MSKKAVLMVFAVILVAFGAASSALAIDGLTPAFPAYVNPGGLGDSLIYGYYNVRGNVDLFNVVNTSAIDGAKVRVVFRAGKNSEEVLDFSVCLSKGDVWTAFLTDSGSTAEICPVFDTDTVTAPQIPASCKTFQIPSGSSLTADDLREGYFEVLGLTSIPGYDKNSTTANANCINVPGNCIKTEVDCANWQSTTATQGTPAPVFDVLMGNNTIINLSTLATYSYNATAIAYPTVAAPVIDPGPGQEVSLVDVDVIGCGVELSLAKTDLISPFDIISGLGAGTEVIVTFPTRRACHASATIPGGTDLGLGNGSGNLFTCKSFTDNTTTGANKKCAVYATPVSVVARDDKENSLNILNFSPAGQSTLPNEVNVLNIGGSKIWTSTLEVGVSVGSFQLGWVDIDLTNSTTAPDGLPALGYTTQALVGGSVSYMVPTAYKSLIP
ncbi:MAG TPA: hypothetical protein VFG09_15150 [Thermodesulfovibrionales bacterium]|nr:hypothetical protein [Thermodesulfovibrionales bacterium]